MLEIKGLTLKYGPSQALPGIDLIARPGQVTALTENLGSGCACCSALGQIARVQALALPTRSISQSRKADVSSGAVSGGFCLGSAPTIPHKAEVGSNRSLSSGSGPRWALSTRSGAMPCSRVVSNWPA